MKKFKKMLSAVLASATVLTSMASYANMFASSAVTICTKKFSGLNNVPYQLSYKVNSDGETITITGCGINDQRLTIPACIDNKKVTIIGENAFAGAKNLKSVVLGSNVKSIEKNAFGANKRISFIIDNPFLKLDASYNRKLPGGITYNKGDNCINGEKKGSNRLTGIDGGGYLFQRGDLHLSGGITVEDAMDILQYATDSTAEKAQWDVFKIAEADVNRDGNVGVDDAQIVLDYYAETLCGNIDPKMTGFEKYLQNNNL